MVIRNAKRRMSGLPVGTWDDQVNPDRVTKEVLAQCEMFLRNEKYHPSSLFRKRKKVVAIAQDDGPSRVSKRLRQIRAD